MFYTVQVLCENLYNDFDIFSMQLKTAAFLFCFDEQKYQINLLSILKSQFRCYYWFLVETFVSLKIF